MYEYEIRNGVSRKDILRAIGTRSEVVQYIRNEIRAGFLLSVSAQKKIRISRSRKLHTIRVPAVDAVFALRTLNKET